MSFPPGSIEEFLKNREQWLEVRAVPRGSGYDVALILDGTYFEHPEIDVEVHDQDREDLVKQYRDELAELGLKFGGEGRVVE